MTARSKRVLALAVAVALGVALAILLVPSAPVEDAPPVASSAPKTSPIPVAPTASVAPPSEPVRAPTASEDASALPAIHQSRTHPPPPNLPGLAEARKKDSVARHAELDAPKWASVASTLSDYGYPDLGTSAAAMAEDLGRLTGRDDPNMHELLDEERRLTQEVRESGALPLVQDQLGLIEEGLNAAQQGGIHPADMPPPPASAGSR